MTSRAPRFQFLFFFNDTATTEIYTLSLHDALPIYSESCAQVGRRIRRSPCPAAYASPSRLAAAVRRERSEEHTSELQSHLNLVCRLLLEKKTTRPRVPSGLNARLAPEHAAHAYASH